MGELSNSFKSIDSISDNTFDTIKQKLEDKCGILDKALLGQFQTDYTKTNSDNLATFEVWGASIIEDFETKFIMAYDENKDVMIIPEGEDHGEYNVCAHEMTHTLMDTKGERKGILLLPGYGGPSIEEIEIYSIKRVDGEEFDIVRGQQELRIIMSSIEHFMNTIPSVLNFIKKETNWANRRLRQITKELDEPWQSEITFEQQKILDQSRLKRLSLWNEGKERRQELADFFDNRLMPAIKEFQVIQMESENNRDILISERYYDNIKCISIIIGDGERIMQIISEVHVRYLEEVEKGLGEIQQMVLENHKIWRREMGIKLDNPNISEEEKSKMEQEINKLMKVREYLHITQALSNKTESISNIIDGAVESINTLKQDSILEQAQKIARDIIGNPGEVFARMIDSLYSVYLGPVDQNNFPLTKMDLDFLSQMHYKGEAIFRKGIEKYRLALQMQEDGVANEEIRKQLVSATSFEYRGILYNWNNEEFHIIGDVPILKDF